VWKISVRLRASPTDLLPATKASSWYWWPTLGVGSVRKMYEGVSGSSISVDAR
jgi:hypothetical protein